MKRISMLIAAMASALPVSFAAAQAADTSGATSAVPATQNIVSFDADGQEVSIFVLSVDGRAGVRDAEAQALRKLAAGMTLRPGQVIETGTRSCVQLQIGEKQVFAVDQLTKFMVLQAGFDVQKGKVVTQAGIEHGRVRFDVEAQDRSYETQVASPNMSLGIRGTKVSVYDQPPFTPQVVSLTGRAEVQDAQKRVRFGGKGKVVVPSDKDSAIAAALGQSVVDPSIGYARSNNDRQLLETVASRGGVIRPDATRNGFPIVTGGKLDFQKDVLSNPPGPLVFTLDWLGNSNWNLGANIFFTGSQAGRSAQQVYPLTGVARTNQGVRTPFDHQAGTAKGGLELVIFPPNFPGLGSGDIQVSPSVQFVKGSSGSTAVLSAIRNGQVVDQKEYSAAGREPRQLPRGTITPPSPPTK